MSVLSDSVEKLKGKREDENFAEKPPRNLVSTIQSTQLDRGRRHYNNIPFHAMFRIGTHI